MLPRDVSRLIRSFLFEFPSENLSKMTKLSLIKISKKGKGVSSILFFLPDNRKDAKVANYLVKADNPIPV